jgi:hypothetical protein
VRLPLADGFQILSKDDLDAKIGLPDNFVFFPLKKKLFFYPIGHYWFFRLSIKSTEYLHPAVFMEVNF